LVADLDAGITLEEAKSHPFILHHAALIHTTVSHTPAAIYGAGTAQVGIAGGSLLREAAAKLGLLRYLDAGDEVDGPLKTLPPGQPPEI
jgi:hypothetical protein